MTQENNITYEQWKKVETFFKDQFGQGEVLSLDIMIYLIGIQELGHINRSFKKDDKINLMHIAICRLLEPYGYYEFDFIDFDGWPHYRLIQKLPKLKSGEQTRLIKEAIVQYFIDNTLI